MPTAKSIVKFPLKVGATKKSPPKKVSLEIRQRALELAVGVHGQHADNIVPLAEAFVKFLAD